MESKLIVLFFLLAMVAGYGLYAWLKYIYVKKQRQKFINQVMLIHPDISFITKNTDMHDTLSFKIGSLVLTLDYKFRNTRALTLRALRFNEFLTIENIPENKMNNIKEIIHHTFSSIPSESNNQLRIIITGTSKYNKVLSLINQIKKSR